MSELSGTLMSENRIVATVKSGTISDYDPVFIPLFFKNSPDVGSWLSSRAIDRTRTNSRLLKRVFRLNSATDTETALAVHGATITDRYWFKPSGSDLSYSDICFKKNDFDGLALFGDPDGFSKVPSRTPELTNTGSFEKCWRLIDNRWWMYKAGSPLEHFSELFTSRIGEELSFDMAYYEMDDSYIRSLDFTKAGSVYFEPISSIMGDNDDYTDCFRTLTTISQELAIQYLRMIWLDTICFNMDRHTENFGFLRNPDNGNIISMAPNYDNNIALISRGYPKDLSRNSDSLIRFFDSFLNECSDAVSMLKAMDIPVITAEMIEKHVAETPFEVDLPSLKSFILNGQEITFDLIEKTRDIEYSDLDR